MFSTLGEVFRGPVCLGMETVDPCPSTCLPCLPVQCVAVLGKADDVFNLVDKAY